MPKSLRNTQRIYVGSSTQHRFGEPLLCKNSKVIVQFFVLFNWTLGDGSRSIALVLILGLQIIKENAVVIILLSGHAMSLRLLGDAGARRHSHCITAEVLIEIFVARLKVSSGRTLSSRERQADKILDVLRVH